MVAHLDELEEERDELSSEVSALGNRIALALQRQRDRNATLVARIADLEEAISHEYEFDDGEGSVYCCGCSAAMEGQDGPQRASRWEELVHVPGCILNAASASHSQSGATP